MSQFELFTIDNPCIGVCQMNKKGYCIGCLRNRAERQHWHGLSDNDKHKILALIARRAKRIAEHRAHARQAELDFTSSLEQLEMFE